MQKLFILGVWRLLFACYVRRKISIFLGNETALHLNLQMNQIIIRGKTKHILNKILQLFFNLSRPKCTYVSYGYSNFSLYHQEYSITWGNLAMPKKLNVVAISCMKWSFFFSIISCVHKWKFSNDQNSLHRIDLMLLVFYSVLFRNFNRQYLASRRYWLKFRSLYCECRYALKVRKCTLQTCSIAVYHGRGGERGGEVSWIVQMGTPFTRLFIHFCFSKWSHIISVLYDCVVTGYEVVLAHVWRRYVRIFWSFA